MKNFWSVIILLALLIGSGLYFSTHEAPVDPADQQAATSTGMVIATTSTARIEDAENRFVATIETPIVSGHISADEFNKLAAIYVERAAEQFAQSAAEANFNIPETFKDQKHEFIAQADTSIIADRYVSVIFTREYGMLTAAHPFHMTETLVYDLENEKVVELSHIFENVQKALEYISSRSAMLVKADLAQSDGEESFIAGGVAPEEANFRAYSTHTSGITFHFAEYQVAPYAAGPQKAMLTWAELRPLLTADFKAFAN